MLLTYFERVFLLFCGIAFGVILPAQNKAVEGSILVMLKPNAKVQTCVEASGISKGQWEVVSHYFNIWSIKVAVGSENAALLKLSTVEGVQWVQREHPLDRRFNPGDPFISSQKHLGLIQAYKAWDYGRGGVTAYGDTLVVAVIDDGMDTTHPDMQNNIWRNVKEVPWNGIDEDSNGYVDDYYGWNGVSQNARVVGSLGGEHGTPIAGIIGAEGGNGKGVAGINHYVKVMSLMGFGGTDAGMIRCYEYVVRMKKRWLESNGAYGANIVATNTSIGIDQAFPSDAPIWCAMYDSMGKYGVLSTAATTNSNRNVEQFGDIPSLCESPYLLVGGNSNEFDLWEPCGYGTFSVDINAPGEATYTISIAQDAGPQGPYRTFGGTSGAAPQLAGAAAWLISVGCDELLNLIARSPDSGALMVKQFIMDGADISTAFNGRNATSGRLNLAKAREKMISWCEGPPPMPTEKTYKIYPNIISQEYHAEWGITLEAKGWNPLKEWPLWSWCDMTGRRWEVRVELVANETYRIILPQVSTGYYYLTMPFEGEVIKHKMLIY